MLALAGIYLILNGIGWAAVFFWKSEAVAMCAAIPAAVLCPAGAICVVPGSQADSPFFFIPLMGVFFLLWAVFIELMWGRLRRTPNQASQPIAGKPGSG